MYSKGVILHHDFGSIIFSVLSIRLCHENKFGSWIVSILYENNDNSVWKNMEVSELIKEYVMVFQKNLKADE